MRSQGNHFLLRIGVRLAPLSYYLFPMVSAITAAIFCLSICYAFAGESFLRIFYGMPFIGLSLMILLLSVLIDLYFLCHWNTVISFNSKTHVTFRFSALITFLKWLKAYAKFPRSRENQLQLVRSYKSDLIENRRLYLVPQLQALGVRKVSISSHFFGVSESACQLKMVEMFGEAIEHVTIGPLQPISWLERLKLCIFGWLGATIRNESRTIIINLKAPPN